MAKAEADLDLDEELERIDASLGDEDGEGEGSAEEGGTPDPDDGTGEEGPPPKPKKAPKAPKAPKATKEEKVATATAKKATGGAASKAPPPKDEAKAPVAAKGEPKDGFPARIADLKPLKHRQRGKDESAYEDEKITTLIHSFRRDGQLQNIVIDQENRVVAGERRVAAARALGWETIRAVRIATDGPGHSAVIGWIENAEREPPNPMAEAEFFDALLSDKKSGFAEQKDLAKALGVSASRVSQVLMRLELPKDLREQLRGGDITVGEADRVVKERRKAAEAPPDDSPRGRRGKGRKSGKVGGAPATRGAVGRPLAAVNLRDLENPKIDLSSSLDFVVKRLDDENFDLRATIVVALPPDFSPESFDLKKEVGKVLKAEFDDAAGGVNVAIESALKRLQRGRAKGGKAQ